MEQERASAVTTSESKVSQLKEQITGLTEQVAVLTMQEKKGAPCHCFNHNQVGHFQCNCPNQERDRQCFECGRWGHTAHQFWQGNILCIP